MGLVRALLQRDPEDVVERRVDEETGRVRVGIAGDRGSRVFDADVTEFIGEANALVVEMDEELDALRRTILMTAGVYRYSSDPEEWLGLRRTIVDAATGETGHLRFGAVGKVFVVIRHPDGTPPQLHETDVIVKSPDVWRNLKRPGLRVGTTTPQSKARA
jgi:hypothetical protein